MNKRILIIGYFGYISNQLDGQTIKTRNLYELLCSKVGNVEYFDTQGFKYSRLSFFRMVKKMIRCDELLYLPGKNNLMYIFPVIFIFSRICRFNISYFIVGGWLDLYLEHKPIHRFMLRNIKVMLAESVHLKRSLIEKYAFNNVELLPNFRSDVPDIKTCGSSGRFNIVFMARICEDKGINTVFRFADYLIKNNLIKDDYPIHINFYGMLDCIEDENAFRNNINKYDFVKYGGVINANDVYSKLSENDVLVLPTKYPGEGLPGSIIESYIVGIPVVVSNWRFLPEFVDHGKTGFVYDLKNEQEFYNYILDLYNNVELLNYMKQQAKIKGQEYTDVNAWKIIKKYI